MDNPIVSSSFGNNFDLYQAIPLSDNDSLYKGSESKVISYYIDRHTHYIRKRGIRTSQEPQNSKTRIRYTDVQCHWLIETAGVRFRKLRYILY